jgi:hypothetical protein
MSVNSHAPWKCYKCGVTGTVPQLHDTTRALTQANIERGHERRGGACHAKFGTAHVRVQLNGVRMICPLIPPVRSESPENAGHSHARIDHHSSGNTAAPAETPAPSTAE